MGKGIKAFSLQANNRNFSRVSDFAGRSGADIADEAKGEKRG